MIVIETDRGSATFMNTYRENIIIMDKEDVRRYRLKMVQDALKSGLKPCTETYRTSVRTFRK